MSAICGLMNLDGSPLPPDALGSIMAALARRVPRGSGTWCEGSAGLGHCRLPITPESLTERPCPHDDGTGLVITADAIIDNRDELLDALCIPGSERACTQDSQLILSAYQKWGGECPEHLLGDYAFAIWDRQRQQLFCARDHAGNRTFYYAASPRLFAFCTLMEPLLALPEVSHGLNETWIADFLTIPSVMHELDPEITLYQDIQQLPPAHTMMVTRQGRRMRRYWNLQDARPVRLGSGEEYAEGLREVLFEAVRCRLRSVRPVGVMMSGGLDSGSVACVAARLLKETGQTLTAFTSVPMEGYKDRLGERRIADETPYVEAVRAYAGNIDVVYSRSEGRDSLAETERYLCILEQPYKIVENLFWIDGLQQMAEERGIGIMLTGQAGNATISWGRAAASYSWLARHGRWGLLLREIREYSARSHTNPLKALAGLSFLPLAPNAVRRLYSRLKAGGDYIAMLSPINPDFARRMHAVQRVRRHGADLLGVPADTRWLLLDPASLGHGGAIGTKLSLAHNMTTRDPTADRRLIEFCMGVPPEQYVQNGQQRWLIRRAMEGILPAQVQWNTRQRGVQSADWRQRLGPKLAEVQAEVRSLADLPLARRYLHLERMCDMIPIVMSGAGDTSTECRLLIRGLVFGRFLRSLEAPG